MADVRDRAQLFLVGALSLAVVFVVLALVVNSAIYTENLATRSTDSGTDDAVEFRTTVESSVGGLVAYENRNTVDTSALQTGIGTVDDRLARFHGRHGAFSSVTYLSDSPGTQLIQDTDREFSNTAGGSNDWELATGVTTTRSFQQRSEIDELDDTSFFGGLFGTDVFRTNVTDDDGDVYSVALYHDSSVGEAYVSVRNQSAGTTRTCTYDYASDSETVTVDLTSAQFAGRHCGALEFWGDLDTPYSIEYVNGQSAEGTWNLVMQGTPTASNYGVAADGPYTKSAIYDVEVRLFYRTDDVTYKTAVTVAPGEPDG